MRTTLALVAAVATLLPAGLSAAQTSTRQETARAPAARQDPDRARFERELAKDLEARKAELAATGVLSDVSAVTTAPPPAHWTKGMDAWRAHMKACSERYRTYDAETDMFVARPGQKERCRL